MSLMEFMREFPDDETCLRHVWRERFSPDGEHADCPRCERERVFKRDEAAPSGVVLPDVRLSHPPAEGDDLRAVGHVPPPVVLRPVPHHQHSMRDLREASGARAWRDVQDRVEDVQQDPEPTHEQDETPLSGSVEADETFVGGKPREADRKRRAALGWNAQTNYWERKAIVFGAAERGGRIRAEVVPNSRASVIEPLARL